MSKYRIKETGSGLYIVLELKDVGGGYCWNDTGRKFESKEAAQAYIDEMRGADGHRHRHNQNTDGTRPYYRYQQGHRRNNLYKVRGRQYGILQSMRVLRRTP